ncbi:type VI secretion system contractile sheath small subunit [Insolitispirillum peregrinum]|uniref:Type VI secretion system protein ImpB n=1 Tax=Insolitispirillum peregrinum TaxID=80876 RepID=A0A1N7JGV1_9PROT|nr:type VI secretion system contractile sheath small subunit [Insolitispirillum peregrinum]SIS48456.1 type VI secretion system protein ImpB [Insolitispirillum peregrinum]
MAESIQHKLDRVRPPRVQITYDVEIGDAIEKKELPFVVGVMADLSAKPAVALPKLKERKFVEIDRDNFNDVMDAAKPRLAFRVPNRLADDDSQLNVELGFKSIEDFEPVNVLKQVPALAKLFEARLRLRDLLAKLDGNDELDALLRSVIASTDAQKELKSSLAKADETPAEA